MLTLFERLSEIHESTLNRFVYKKDKEQFNVKEYWIGINEIPETGWIKGDCDDFALACRKECRRKGIQSRLVLCKTENGRWHLVLESSGWILDNRFKFVEERDWFTGYTWKYISSYEKGGPWFKVEED